MNTEQNIDNIAAPSVTIAPRFKVAGAIVFVVTLMTPDGERSYPCRSKESAMNLAERFIAGVLKPAPAKNKAQEPKTQAQPAGGKTGSVPVAA